MKGFALHIHYLSGRCVATAYNDRDGAEWPPHPARLFSALVATWAESEDPTNAERAALEWLAALPAPSIVASGASRRQVVPHFVPVNDTQVLDGFERQRTKLSELEEELARTKAEYATAQQAGDGKTTTAVAKALGKLEKAAGAERKKLEKAMLDNQGPYAPGKHPKAGLASAWALIPEQRGKQPRSFPSLSLDDPNVFVRWEASESEFGAHRAALATLAARVVRLGHSASLVSCRLTDDCPTPTWAPSETGDEVLRVPDAGQLARLQAAYARHREIEPRVLPCRFQRYSRVGNAVAQAAAMSCFGDDWIVFRQVRGRRLAQTCNVEVAQAMRQSLMKYANDPPPELLSGHTSSGEPSQRPHVAIVPLPFVGSTYASGELLGVALLFPRDADGVEREALLRAIGMWEEQRRKEVDDDQVDTPPLELGLGKAGTVHVERIEWGAAPLKTLRPKTWCGPASCWVTATPLALDRNPGDLRSRDPGKQQEAFEAAEQSIATACERIGLPRPSYVQVHPSVPLVGAVKARSFPPFPADPRKTRRVKVHARIEFSAPVRGPVLLGAGRYYGLGLCLPLPREARIEP